MEIEAIFSECNIDEDCDTIARLLVPYRKSIQEALGKGEHATAVTVFLAILESLTRHFMEDEHYNYFDDMYSPDYVCQDMIEAIIDSAIGGNFPDEEMRRLYERAPEVTAVFCANDLAAIGALRYLKEIGMRVPEDMSLVGCDNIEMTQYYTPTLSTIDVPKYEMGVKAVEMLMRLCKGQSTNNVWIPSRYVRRESTGYCKR